MRQIALAPHSLDFEVDAHVRIEGDWHVRRLSIPDDLDGPSGILQGGLAAGLVVPLAQAADANHAPPTAFQSRLHAPTPLGAQVDAWVRRSDGVSTYVVEVRHGDRLLISGTVELAGAEISHHVHDLAELARVVLPPAQAQEQFTSCWICGHVSASPRSLRLFPSWIDDATVGVDWLPPDDYVNGSETLDPLLQAAVLDCPTTWACARPVLENGWRVPMLGSFDVSFLRPPRARQLLRVVARCDASERRKFFARGALVDDDGVIYAVANATQIALLDVEPDRP